ncbi:acyltransferase family protein [Methylobacterium marchantiae]|uniref:Acyltransferase family protein n=1 Tax=Methylobacterium marchantiae TaxID=600331 RepID=A0ABW3WY79_9HYPH|nr:hypothetical protein AIGOOFII_3803 [Methylobacterium marchantiae]
MPPRHLIGIDLIRFSAAAFVLLFHLGAWLWLVPGVLSSSIVPLDFNELLPIARNGWIGVEIFFVVSGFVIAYSASEATSHGFARSRFLRLVPAAWICASLTLVASWVGGSKPLIELLPLYAKAVMFWPGGPWIDGVYWTLGIEIAFYAVVFGLLACRVWRFMPQIVGAIGLTSTAFQIAAWFLPSLAALTEKRAIQLALVNDGCLFALGTYLWLTLTVRATRVRLVMVAILSAGAVLEIIGHNDHFMRVMGISGGAGPALALFVGSVTLLVVSVLFNDRLADALGPRWVTAVRTAGLATYPLYLVHNVCGAVILMACVAIGYSPYQALLIAILGVLILALTVTLGAEPRLRSLLARLIPRRAAAREVLS